MKALILTDGKAGHENQSKAFARALGCDFDLVPVRFRSKFAKMLSYLFDRLGLHTCRLFKLRVESGELRKTLNPQPSSPIPYHLIIGTGSGTFYAAKTLSRRLGVPCGVVLYPRGYRIAGFTCILAPEFDNPPPAPNVITIPVNLVASDASFYANGVQAFRERHAASTRPAVAVIVGGPNKCSRMSANWMRAQLERIFAAHPDCEKWVTTSRRTPPDVEAVVDSFPFDYKLIYSRDHFNPIPAFVSLAAHLYVTAESTGMLSEACTSGSAEVHVMDNLLPGPHKFRRFAESCATLGTRKIDLTPQFAAAKHRLLFR